METPAEKIPMTPVESSSLQSIGYNAEKHILAVAFRSGAVFHYAGISEEVYETLSTAESLGKMFAATIRGKFTGAKMTGQCPSCGDNHGWLGETCTDCGTAAYAPDPPKVKTEATP